MPEAFDHNESYTGTLHYTYRFFRVSPLPIGIHASEPYSLAPFQNSKPVPPPAHFSAPIATALGAFAVGALAVGAMAIGALAIGALTIRKMQVGQANLKDLHIDHLTIGQLDVQSQAPEMPTQP